MNTRGIGDRHIHAPVFFLWLGGNHKDKNGHFGVDRYLARDQPFVESLRKGYTPSVVLWISQGQDPNVRDSAGISVSKPCR